MKKIITLLFSVLTLSLSGCNTAQDNSATSKHEHEIVSISVSRDAYKRTYINGSDFDRDGLIVRGTCSSCNEIINVEFSLENDKNLELNQKNVTIKYENLTLEYAIKVVEKYHIACVGDSLTKGHMWENESYPTKLSGIVDEHYEVGNFGINGISITGYGGNSIKYLTDPVYQKSVAFDPDIIPIMLGTNDATGWANAEATFVEDYHILLDSYIEQFPFAKFIMMVSPPVVTPNQFSIPNDTIRDEVNPVQRELAEEYGFELLDLREEFEATDNYQSKFLRPNNDNVHFTSEGAEYVANRVWDIAKDLTF